MLQKTTQSRAEVLGSLKYRSAAQWRRSVVEIWGPKRHGTERVATLIGEGSDHKMFRIPIRKCRVLVHRFSSYVYLCRFNRYSHLFFSLN